MKIRLSNNYSKFQFGEPSSELILTTTSNNKVEPNLDKYLLKLVHNYEKTVEHKLNILIIGSSHHELGIALANYGNKITFITWDIDDHKKLRVIIDKSKFGSKIDTKLINLKTIESLNAETYDILFSLIPMYGLLSGLDFNRQKIFFEYVFKNIDSVFWLLPVRDENNPLDIYLPSQKTLDFFINYDYVMEVARVKLNINSSQYPLVYTSKSVLLMNCKFYRNNHGKIIKNNGSIYSRIYFHKNKLQKVCLSNKQGYSSVESEYLFLSNLKFKEKIILRTPRKMLLNQGLMFDSFQRKKLNGVDLHQIECINDSHKILEEFIKLCKKFSKFGLYHNDIRPWNILWDGKKCVFIDFENSSRYDQDVQNFPQILFFFATANYIKKLEQLKSWDIEAIIQQNREYMSSTEAYKFYASWEKMSIANLNELLKIDYCDVKTGFKQLIELLESY
jgi:hypothetical protein